MLISCVRAHRCRRRATELEEPTAQIEQLAADFLSQLERIDPGISHLLSQIEEEPQLREDDDAKEFIEGIKKLAEAAEEGLGQIGMLADTVKGLGQISNRIRPVSRRLSTALRRISDSVNTMRTWGQRLNALD